MNTNKTEEKAKMVQKAHEDLALSLFAGYVDVEAAEALAKKEGWPFNRERALRHIENVMGEDEAKAARYHWSPEAEAKLFSKAQKGIEQGLRLAAMDRLLANFKNSLKRSAQQLADMLNPANYQASPMRAFRAKGQDQDNTELVEPNVDYEEGRLSVSLDFPPNVGPLPSCKNDIQLFIDGEPVEQFEFSAVGQFLSLGVPVDPTQEERYRHLSCAVHYNAENLNQLAICLEQDAS